MHDAPHDTPTDTHAKPWLSVVIVSWNVAGHLQRCLDSIDRAYGRDEVEVIVVDNASSDRTAEVARGNRDIQFLPQESNTGFARASNIGARAAHGQDLLLLNPDTIVPQDFFLRLRDSARRNAQAGIIGPNVRNSDGSLQHSVRRFPTLGSQVVILLKLHHLFPGIGPYRTYMMCDDHPKERSAVDQVMGACFYIRRDCWEQAGPLDEGYWIWFEEVDLCRRARDAGWPTFYDPSFSITHVGSASFGQVRSLDQQRKFIQSLSRYARNYFSLPQRAVLRALAPIALALTALTQWKPSRRHF